MKLDKYLKFKIIITLKTGLHIGAGATKIEIGGMDNPIIKDNDGYAYIPGSSLKGKLRSLLELSLGKFSDDGGVCECGEIDCPVCRFFGPGKSKVLEESGIGPTRIIVRDLCMTQEWKDKVDQYRNYGKNFYEEKMEVSIDRKSGTASKSGPRPLERVPAGTQFEGEIIFRIFELPQGIKSDEELLKDSFGENLEKFKGLLENDYLGGQGSRGSGQIEMTIKRIEG